MHGSLSVIHDALLDWKLSGLPAGGECGNNSDGPRGLTRGINELIDGLYERSAIDSSDSWQRLLCLAGTFQFPI